MIFELVDTHSHLYSNQFGNDIKAVVGRCVEQGVHKVFLPAIDAESHENLLRLAETDFGFSEQEFRLYPMMGLHPCSVKENFEEELQLVKHYFETGPRFYAVGEIGLDYYWDVTFKQQQQLAFERQIELAIELGLPIVIHSRNSTPDCIATVRKYNGAVKGIFHCFGGSAAEAKEIIDLGLYLGIGGVVSYKNSGLREVLTAIGPDKLVLETDAPYLAPVPHRGKRNESSYLHGIAQTVADAVGLSLEHLAQITSRNAYEVFQLESVK